MIDNTGSKAKKEQGIAIKRFLFNNQINTH